MPFGTFLVLGKIKIVAGYLYFFSSKCSPFEIFGTILVCLSLKMMCAPAGTWPTEKVFFSSKGFNSEAGLSIQVLSGTENSSLHFLLRQFGLVGGANLFTGCQVRVSAVVIMRRRMFQVKLSILRKVFVWNHLTL